MKYKEVKQEDLQEPSRIKILTQLSVLDLDPEIKIQDYDFIYINLSWNMSKILKNEVTNHKGVHSSATIDDILKLM